MRGMRPVSIVLFVIAVSALVGGLFGRSALAVDDKLTERYATFSAALSRRCLFFRTRSMAFR